MTASHKLTAGISRLRFQLDGSVAFLQIVTPLLPDDDDDPKRQYLYKSTTLMVQSYFEELRIVSEADLRLDSPALRNAREGPAPVWLRRVNRDIKGCVNQVEVGFTVRLHPSTSV